MYFEITYILFFLSCLIEPVIWIYAFGLKLHRKYKLFWPYMIYIAVDYGTALLERFLGLFDGASLVYTVFMIIYVLAFAILLYDGTITEKIMCTCCMFLSALASDALSLGFFSFMGHSMQELSEFGLSNMLATIVSKTFLFAIVNIAFRKKNMDYEYIPIMISTILMELPAVELFNRMNLIQNKDSFFMLYVVSQMGLLVVLGYVSYLMKRHKKSELEYKERARDMEMQLEGTEAASEVYENLRMLRHDMKYQVGTVRTLLKDKKYDEAEKYLDCIYKDVDIAEHYFTLKNRNVSLILDRIRQKAKEEGVGLYTKIMTDEFGISDRDICSVLINICMNAIEAAMDTDEKYVKLVISNCSNGYQIECENSYKGSLRMKKGEYKTTKGDGRGLGIKIVKKVVRNNRGKASFIGNNGIFKVYIFIPRE